MNNPNIRKPLEERLYTFRQNANRAIRTHYAKKPDEKKEYLSVKSIKGEWYEIVYFP